MNHSVTMGLIMLGITLLIIPILSIQQSYAIETMTANLSEVDDNQFMQGTTIYKEISGLTSNSTLYQDIKSGDGFIYNTVSDDALNIQFPAKIPDPDNPNRENVIDVNARLNVDSIETNPETGLKTYYTEPEFSTLASGDVWITEGQLQQTDDDEAILTLILGQ